MNSEKALVAYNLPHFEEILTDDFRYQYGLMPAGQYGVACIDVQAECRKAETLGAGPFLTAKIPAPNWVENGIRKKCSLDFALGYAGNQQLEFLGPGKGSDFYADALQGRDYVLHHVGVFQNNIEALEKKLNASGFKTVVDGGIHFGQWLGFRFKYFDTREALGCYLELLDFYFLGKPITIEQPVKHLGRVQSRCKR